jgi:hypothetical protein
LAPLPLGASVIAVRSIEGGVVPLRTVNVATLIEQPVVLNACSLT